MRVTRRTFLGTAASSVAAITTLGSSPASASAELVYRHADWNFAEFDALLKFKGRGRQVYDCHPLNDGSFFSAIKNSLNGLQFGFDIPADQIKIVTASHGPCNLLNFDDSMWAKYRIGELLKLDDPATGKPATRNIFYPKKNPSGSTNPNDRASIYQDSSIEALQGRGLQLLSCHNSTEGQAMSLIKLNGLKDPVESVVADLQSHMLPGVIAVPAMVAAIAMLQTEGHYSYIAAP
jgi:intracellular sulfur oxidation DsrE/DsrF family protein